MHLCDNIKINSIHKILLFVLLFVNSGFNNKKFVWHKEEKN